MYFGIWWEKQLNPDISLRQVERERDRDRERESEERAENNPTYIYLHTPTYPTYTSIMDADDDIPMLVDVEGKEVNAEAKEAKPIKVPITIVTGKFLSIYNTYLGTWMKEYS